ncbi:MucR family transcriptional regulator [Bosea sp. BIWAKO-01]|uniref:MucR family transcriptional regulator n=1 Tax=Bosea sp. BIWAKO-01 TaxID=506668 RepID=UPI000852FE61|nr:MucR family transcriptional regulator [Bosea sp. BIWAKO-01]GAU86905.1 transcriptional regulator [Bosea sp. BIWAKO-01]
MTKEDDNFADLTAMVISAYVAHNNLPRSELVELISSTYSALTQLGAKPEIPSAPVVPVPAVPIKKSVTADAIICLEDGKAFKSLRRHLGTAYNLTPEQYRAKWGLPSDYPMVAPNYSEARAALAKASGLGRKAKVTTAAPVVAKPPRAKRGPRSVPSA